MGEHKTKEWYDKTYASGVNQFERGIFLERAERFKEWAIEELLSDRHTKLRHTPGASFNVFEFAAGGTAIALKLAEIPHVQYLWNDFCEPAIQSANMKLPTGDRFCMNTDDVELCYEKLLAMYPFHVVISVSWEHLEKDREIMQAIAPGTCLLLSCPTIDADDHLRVLDTEEKIVERYGDLIEIEKYERLDILQLVKARRR